jgi:hypothetical protein
MVSNFYYTNGECQFKNVKLDFRKQNSPTQCHPHKHQANSDYANRRRPNTKWQTATAVTQLSSVPTPLPTPPRLNCMLIREVVPGVFIPCKQTRLYWCHFLPAVPSVSVEPHKHKYSEPQGWTQWSADLSFYPGDGDIFCPRNIIFFLLFKTRRWTMVMKHEIKNTTQHR